LLSKYSRKGASSRLRTLQFIPELERLGVSVTVSPLFDDRYLEQLYTGGGRNIGSLLSYYAARATLLKSLEGVDIIWLEKECFPYVPYLLESVIMPSDIPYVVDYDDAVFHNYDLSPSRIVRMALRRKIDRVMRRANVVVCGNRYLVNRAKSAGAKKVCYVPTVVDPRRYYSGFEVRERPLTIGWIGSPSTQKYLMQVRDVLINVCTRFQAELLLIGADKSVLEHFSGISLRIEPWSEDNEASLIAEMSLGIMPLPDGPWEEGKCGYKLIQYMASGVPFVASPVGANVAIAESCGGLLAKTPSEWQEKTSLLLADFELRKKIGQAGRFSVIKNYSVSGQVLSVRDALYEALM